MRHRGVVVGLNVEKERLVSARKNSVFGTVRYVRT